jgi:hypothetical protein
VEREEEHTIFKESQETTDTYIRIGEEPENADKKFQSDQIYRNANGGSFRMNKREVNPEADVKTYFPTSSIVLSWSIVADALHSSKSKALNHSAADTSPEPEQIKPGVWPYVEGFPSIGDFQ